MRFRYNPRVVEEVCSDPRLHRLLLARAIDVKKGIAGNLPSGATGGKRVSSYSRKAYAEIEGAGRDAHAVVGTKWRLGHIIEFGSVNNPAYAPLRKSVRQTGLKFEES
jgi:hypothetical protein